MLLSAMLHHAAIGSSTTEKKETTLDPCTLKKAPLGDLAREEAQAEGRGHGPDSTSAIPMISGLPLLG